MELALKYTIMESIMKENGNKVISMEKATYNSVMGVIAVANSWRTSFMAMLSTVGQDRNVIVENGR